MLLDYNSQKNDATQLFIVIYNNQKCFLSSKSSF